MITNQGTGQPDRYDLGELENALRKAHAAGNVQHARTLADAYRSERDKQLEETRPAGTWTEVDLPDGSIAEFPANMPTHEIERVLRQHYSQPSNSGPWEKYQQAESQQPQQGPWTQYQAAGQPSAEGPWTQYQQANPPLPPGFVLEDSQQGLPPLPPGFELMPNSPDNGARAAWQDDPIVSPSGTHQGGAQPWLDDPIVSDALELDIVGGTPVPAAEFAQQPQPSLAEREGRGLGLGVRSAVQGVGGLVGALGGDAFNAYVVDPVRRQLHSPGLSDLVTGNAEFQPSPSFRDIAGNLADLAGLPRPQDARERVLGDVGEALSGTAATMGLGGWVNALANVGRPSFAAPVTNRLAQLATSQPVIQATSAATGSAASSMTREGGGGTGAQIAAGLAGGLAPGALSGLASILPLVRPSGSIPYAVGTATRTALRGQKNNPDLTTSRRTAADVAATIKDFQAAGTTPSIGQAGGSRVGQALETYAGNVPGGSGRIAAFGQQQSREVSSRIDDLATRLSGKPSQDQTTVGRNVMDGVSGSNADAFIPRTRAVADELYRRVDDALPPGTRVGVDRTRKALASLNAQIQGAPNVSRFFQNARIQGIEGALTEDTSGLAGALARPEVRQQAEAIRRQLQTESEQAGSAVQAYAEQIRARIQAQVEQTVQENARRRSMGLHQGQQPVMTGRQIEEAVQQQLSALPKPLSSAEIDQQVNSWLTGQIDDQLPYEALSRLRTLVGNEIDNYSLVDNVPRSKWKELYGALTDDMGAAASTPKARQVWNRANFYYKSRLARLEAVEAVVNRNGGPERVYNAAFADVKHGGTTIRAVMQSLPKEAQRDLTAAFVRRMGRATNNRQDSDGAVFSMESFLTKWNDISPDARRALFDRHGADFSRNMDKIARMASAARDSNQVFYNSSGTARLGALIAQVGGTASVAGGALATGHLGSAVMALLGSGLSALSANRAANFLTNPKYVRWLATNADKPVGEALGHLQVLRQIAERDGDKETIELAESLEGAVRQRAR